MCVMKRMITIAAAVMLLVAAGACEKYEDGRPSKDVRTEFARMYPGAWDVEWEPQGGYWKVSFETGSRPNGVDNEAWYQNDGTWIRTSTDMLLVAVPQQIKDYLAASEYGSGQVEGNDVEYCQTPTGNFYRFDIRFGGREIEVDVTEGGEVTPADYGF